MPCPRESLEGQQCLDGQVSRWEEGSLCFMVHHRKYRVQRSWRCFSFSNLILWSLCQGDRDRSFNGPCKVQLPRGARVSWGWPGQAEPSQWWYGLCSVKEFLEAAVKIRWGWRTNGTVRLWVGTDWAGQPIMPSSNSLSSQGGLWGRSGETGGQFQTQS